MKAIGFLCVWFGCAILAFMAGAVQALMAPHLLSPQETVGGVIFMLMLGAIFPFGALYIIFAGVKCILDSDD